MRTRCRGQEERNFSVESVIKWIWGRKKKGRERDKKDYSRSILPNIIS